MALRFCFLGSHNFVFSGRNAAIRPDTLTIIELHLSRYWMTICRTLYLPFLFTSLFLFLSAQLLEPDADGDLVLKKTLYGSIRPKSVVFSGKDKFFAQNMMYRHTITVYDRNFKLLKTISDKVELRKLGFPEYEGKQNGAPVEAAFSENGRFAWVSQYHMDGPGFDNPGTDNCKISKSYDNSFVYKIDTESLEIVAAVEVGCIPKFMAVTPDDRYLLVSNWCSGDVSVVDIEIAQEIKRIPLGRYPRGIAIDSRSQRAYVAVMGSDQIAEINLADLSLVKRHLVGKRPRHLCLGPFDRFLYMSLNNEGKVAKMDLLTHEVVGKIETGNKPRSMILSPMGGYLYVVNYADNTLSKVRTSDMKELEEVSTNAKPIGLTIDPVERRIWVACYSGSIMVFEDTGLAEQPYPAFAYSEVLPRPPKPETQSLPLYSYSLASIANSAVVPVSDQPAPATETDEFGFASVADEFALPEVTETATSEIIEPAPAKPSSALATSSIAPKPSPKPAPDSPKKTVDSPAETKAKPKVGAYTLILASFAGKTNANKEIKRLAKQKITTALLISGGRYRVKYGEYDTKEDAVTARSELIAQSMDAWVLRQ